MKCHTSCVAVKVSYLAMISLISWNSSADSTTLYKYFWKMTCLSSFFCNFSLSLRNTAVSSFNLYDTNEVVYSCEVASINCNWQTLVPNRERLKPKKENNLSISLSFVFFRSLSSFAFFTALARFESFSWKIFSEVEPKLCLR